MYVCTKTNKFIYICQTNIYILTAIKFRLRDDLKKIINDDRIEFY